MAKHTSGVTQKDKKREFVFRDLDAHRMTAVEAALRWIGERQVWRLLAAFRQEGAEAVVHGSRGRAPTQTLSPELHQRIAEKEGLPFAASNIPNPIFEYDASRERTMCGSSGLPARQPARGRVSLSASLT